MFEPLRRKTKILCSKKHLPKYAWYEDEDVVSAVRFYKKYRVSTEHIKENYQLGGVYNIELWNDYPELIKEYLNHSEKSFNEWLFDYCFGDVIK